MKRVLAFDIGASSGRAMLAVYDQGKIACTEIHRFENIPVTAGGTLYWDVLRLFGEIKQGITLAVAQGGFDAMGIDTWGVDFGLLDGSGRLMGNPVHYRDLRTSQTHKALHNIVSKEALYQQSGIQFMRFNTIYQLYEMLQSTPQLVAAAHKLLLMPDLLAYFLTGECYAECTNASTGSLLDPWKHGWNLPLMEQLSLPAKLFPPILDAGERYGPIREEVCAELGCRPVPVVAVGTHDTASAVVSVPTRQKDFVYISCGTWSLFGTELEQPLINDQALAHNFTNESGYGHSVRFLKNIMGLWLIQESRRQWMREGHSLSYGELEQEAVAAPPFRCYVDVDAATFETPGDLPGRIADFCKHTGQYVPTQRGEIMRCVYDSLAMKYRRTLLSLQALTGRSYRHIHMIGGGIKDTLLCRLTASACNVQVVAGPTEATIMGNVAVQLISLGELSGVEQARAVIADSISPTSYLPEDVAAWEAHYEDYLEIMRRYEEDRNDG